MFFCFCIIDPYYPTCELETSEVSTYDDSENHGPKDKMSLEIELELALEVEDQIRASVIEYEETETSLNREISSLK